MGAQEIRAFLTCFATNRGVSASTQNQALSSVLFLYRDVLHIEIGRIENVPHARMPVRVPVILSRDEVARIMKRIDGVAWIIVALLYGASLRLQECLELRVKDIDLERRRNLIRHGKGQKDPPTVLPRTVIEPLLRHLEAVQPQHQADLAPGFGRVVLPFALDRKYANAPTDWAWEFVFPASRVYGSEMGTTEPVPRSRISRTEGAGPRRHGKRASPNVWAYTHSAFVCNPSARGRVRHPDGAGTARPRADVGTTMVYTHVLNRGPLGVRSAVDRL